MKSTLNPLLLPVAFLFVLAACGPADEDSGSDSDSSGAGMVVIHDPEVNGSSVTCSRVYEVDASAWPSEGYPTGASGIYRYVSDSRYDGPMDGRMPIGNPTGFYLNRQERDGAVWTIMSTKGMDGTDGGYPWDHQAQAKDCPDGNATWVNGVVVKAR